jgi:hypothetical protein
MARNTKDLQSVVGQLNSDAAYRGQLLSNPKGFLQSELGVEISDQLSNEIATYFSSVKGTISRPNFKFGLPENVEELVYGIFM